MTQDKLQNGTSVLSYLEWIAHGYNTVQFVTIVTHDVMTGLLWQTVEQHCAAVLAILVPVPHGPFVHLVVEQMLEADLQLQVANTCQMRKMSPPL